MEGYVFAMMANSGTDPELEEEVAADIARRQSQQQENERQQREKIDRYLVPVDEDGQSIRKSADMLLVDASRKEQKPVLDHYRATWSQDRPRKRSPYWSSGTTSPFMSPEFALQEQDEEEEEQEEKEGKRKQFDYIRLESLINVQGLPRSDSGQAMFIHVDHLQDITQIARNSKEQRRKDYQNIFMRPSCFQPSLRSDYCPLPPLNLAMPQFPRNPFPMAPLNADAKLASLSSRLKQRDQIHRVCCVPPKHPVHGLMYGSISKVKRHYNSMDTMCRLVQHELDKEKIS